MRYLIVIVIWLLVFLAAVFCVSVSAETLMDAEQGLTEEVQKDSQDMDKEGDEESSDDSPLPEFLLSSEVEWRMLERARRTLEETEKQERSRYTLRTLEEAEKQERSRYILSSLFSYTDQGIDQVLPEHFFRGHIVSQGFSFLHRSGFRFSAENLTSLDGGGFSDPGDRMVLDFKVWEKFSFLYAAMQNRLVYASHKADQGFSSASRIQTALRFGFLLGSLQPHVFVLWDGPPYLSVNEVAVYGGAGLDLRFNIDRLSTGLYFGASVAESLYSPHNQGRKALYRLRAGFATSVGDFVVNPELLFLKGVYTSESLLTTSFRIAY